MPSCTDRLVPQHQSDHAISCLSSFNAGLLAFCVPARPHECHPGSARQDRPGTPTIAERVFSPHGLTIHTEAGSKLRVIDSGNCAGRDAHSNRQGRKMASRCDSICGQRTARVMLYLFRQPVRRLWRRSRTNVGANGSPDRAEFARSDYSRKRPATCR